MMTNETVASGSNFDDIVRLPLKTGDRYVQAYERFLDWRKSKNTESFDEETFMEFFTQESKTKNSNTLYSIFSMLKATVRIHHNVSIGEYTRLIAFLKEQTKLNYGPKRTLKLFTNDDLRKFLAEAPDSEYLGVKTAAIFGICGVWKVGALTNTRVDMVEDCGNEIALRIPDCGTRTTKTYSVRGEYAEIVRKYLKLRPAAIKTDRLFLLYRNGKCISQVNGKNTMLQTPKKIAMFLQLPDPNSYSVHSYRGLSLAGTGDKLKIGSVVSNRIRVRKDCAIVLNTQDDVDFDTRIKQEDDFVVEDFDDTCDSEMYNTDSNLDGYSDHQDFVVQTTKLIQQNDSSKSSAQTDQRRTNGIEFVNVTLESEPGDNGSSCPNGSQCQSTIREQAEEIVRLKKLAEKQSLEIEILKDLLQKSMKQNLRDELLSESRHVSPIPIKVERIDE